MFLSRRWRTAMQTALLLLSIGSLAAQTVVNSGVPGENTAEILKRSVSVIASARPTYVILFAGMNDAVNEKKFLSSSQTRDNVEAIVRNAKAAGATTILVNVHAPDDKRLLARHDPKVYADRSPSQRIDDLNNILFAIAQADHLAIADFHDALQRAGGANASLSTDGVHLTATGYALLAATVRSALPPNLSGATILCLGDSLTYGIGVRAADAEEEGPDTYPAQLRHFFAGNR